MTERERTREREREREKEREREREKERYLPTCTPPAAAEPPSCKRCTHNCSEPLRINFIPTPASACNTRFFSIFFVREQRGQYFTLGPTRHDSFFNRGNVLFRLLIVAMWQCDSFFHDSFDDSFLPQFFSWQCVVTVFFMTVFCHNFF